MSLYFNLEKSIAEFQLWGRFECIGKFNKNVNLGEQTASNRQHRTALHIVNRLEARDVDLDKPGLLTQTKSVDTWKTRDITCPK